MKCPECNNELPAGAKFCNQCGTKIEEQGKTCPNPDCKRTGLPPEAVYCPECGWKLTGNFASFTETVNGVNFNMVAVEGGSFLMGSPPDEPNRSDNETQHRVTLSNYFIGKFPVTQDLWQIVMGENPRSYFKGDNFPVEMKSWDDCHVFLGKLNRLTGKKYGLPTEAQWEFAARGGNKSKGYFYSGSNKIRKVAWYGSRKTHPVGQKAPNELGIYDMSGNVWEWCNDWYDAYSSTPQTDPAGSSSGPFRVVRGGSWGNYYYARSCRVSTRNSYSPDYLYNNLGFRLVASLE